MPQPLYRLSLLLSCPLLLTLVTSAPAAAWQYTASAGSNAVEDARAVAVDERTGHVVAAGTLFHDGSGFTFSALKVTRQHGHEIWRFELPGAEPGFARAVAIDPDGHVVVAGVAGPPSPRGGRLTVVELDGDSGALRWITQIAGGDAFDVGIDAAGDVIAAGVLDRAMGVVKLAGDDGSELWRARPSGEGSGGQVRSLALDAAGDPVVAGFTRNADFRNQLTVVKLAGSDGSEAWRFTIEPHRFSGTDEAIAVEVDPAGDVVAAGSVRIFVDNALPAELTVVKLAGADGSLAWRRDVSPGQPSDLPRALALDAAGDVVVLGTLGTESGFHSAVVKLAGEDGSDEWRQLFDPAFESDVTVDAAGDVVTAGGATGPDRFDVLVRKLVGATGALVWTARIDGAGDGDDLARAVATDADGHVVGGGHLHGGATGPDLAVFKLDGATGDDFEWPEHGPAVGPGR